MSAHQPIRCKWVEPGSLCSVVTEQVCVQCGGFQCRNELAWLSFPSTLQVKLTIKGLMSAALKDVHTYMYIWDFMEKSIAKVWYDSWTQCCASSFQGQRLLGSVEPSVSRDSTSWDIARWKLAKILHQFNLASKSVIQHCNAGLQSSVLCERVMDLKILFPRPCAFSA